MIKNKYKTYLSVRSLIVIPGGGGDVTYGTILEPFILFHYAYNFALFCMGVKFHVSH